MTDCAKCGAENPPGATFCQRCNHYLSWTEPTPNESARARARKSVQTTPKTHREQPKPRAAKPEPNAVQRVGELLPQRGGEASVHSIIAAIDSGKQIATTRGRSDLHRHLDQARERVQTRTVPVVVVGEFKQGKSSLINALLLRPGLLPVDADVVTALPTTVRYAEQEQVIRYVRSADGELLVPERMPFDAIARLVTERAGPDEAEGERMVEIGLPHGMLRTGMALIDTPGVGGLDSADGHLALGALAQAEGVLFVSDAAQELTDPELTFLRMAAERCSRVALVMPKIDLYPHWRRIAEINRGHLQRASLDIPVIPVSSFLRLEGGKARGEAREVLTAEARYPDLMTFLARDVVRACRETTAQTAAAEVDFVATQLQQQAQAERAVIAAPERAAEVVAELDAVQRQARTLASPSATWKQTLMDGMAKMEADIDFDLQQRLRTIMRDAEAEIDRDDPKDTWNEIESWLRRAIAMAAVENRDLLTQQATELATKVAEQFELPGGSGLKLDIDTGDALERIKLAPAATLMAHSNRLAPFITAARTGYLPVAVGGALASLVINPVGTLAAAAILGLSALVGGGVGFKMFSGERQRQRQTRQQVAKNAVRKFIDDVSFLVTKQTRDSIRAARQQLRDDFQVRALQLARSAQEAANAAERASQMDSTEQQQRVKELAVQERQLARMRSAAGIAPKDGRDE